MSLCFDTFLKIMPLKSFYVSNLFSESSKKKFLLNIQFFHYEKIIKDITIELLLRQNLNYISQKARY